MGDRGQIRIQQFNDNMDSIFLYTHNRGSEIYGILKRAMSRRERWSDETYLARIIFCEMVKGDEQGTTGAGMSLTPFDVEHTTLGVNCREQTITFEDSDNGQIKSSISFNAFISRLDKWSQSANQIHNTPYDG